MIVSIIGLATGIILISRPEKLSLTTRADSYSCTGSWTCTCTSSICASYGGPFTYQCSNYSSPQEVTCTGGNNTQGNYCNTANGWTRTGGCTWNHEISPTPTSPPGGTNVCSSNHDCIVGILDCEDAGRQPGLGNCSQNGQPGTCCGGPLPTTAPVICIPGDFIGCYTDFQVVPARSYIDECDPTGTRVVRYQCASYAWCSEGAEACVIVPTPTSVLPSCPSGQSCHREMGHTTCTDEGYYQGTAMCGAFECCGGVRPIATPTIVTLPSCPLGQSCHREMGHTTCADEGYFPGTVMCGAFECCGSARPPSPTPISATTPVITGIAVGCGKATLSWTSTGKSSNYTIERCKGTFCSNFAQISSTQNLLYSDTTVVSSTTYRYRIKSYSTFTKKTTYSSPKSVYYKTAASCK